MCPSESLAGASSQAHIGCPDLGTTSAEAPPLCPRPSPVGPEMKDWVLLAPSEALRPVVECTLALTRSDSCGRLTVGKGGAIYCGVTQPVVTAVGAVVCDA